MKSISPLHFLTVLALLGSTFLFTPSMTLAEDLPTYKPPQTGSPTRRVGGGTRSAGGLVPLLAVLAPEHTGQVLKAQPVLYWSVSGQLKQPLTLSISHFDAQRPLQKGAKLLPSTPIPPPQEAGIYALDLSDYEIELKSGEVYEWELSLQAPGGQRVITSATIERIEAPSKLAQSLKNAQQRQLPSLYAEAGLWYDAIESLSALIKEHPQDTLLRAARAGLLKQVGLPQVAELDKLN